MIAEPLVQNKIKKSKGCLCNLQKLIWGMCMRIGAGDKRIKDEREKGKKVTEL